MLLLLPDAQLVELIDRLVLGDEISIPPEQTRRARQSPPAYSLFGRSELSHLGLRAPKGEPAVRLAMLVCQAYAQLSLEGDLLWRLGRATGDPPLSGLLDYLRERGPRETIRSLVLSTRGVTEAVCKKLGFSVDLLLDLRERAMDVLLWKLGFNPARYDEFSQRFSSQLHRFNQAVIASPEAPNDDDRERIRSNGVNLFVYVERFIDLLVSYNIWLLSSDHFLGTDFVFDLEDGRKRVAEVLGHSLATDDVEFNWNAGGVNNLSVLLRYLAEAVSWMKTLHLRDYELIRRPEAELPHFTFGKEERFPFFHSEFWADCDRGELQRYADSYERMARMIHTADLLEVRNGLDHWRDPSRFPNADAMLACVARLKEAYDLSRTKRHLPEIRWLQSIETTRSKLVRYVFEDIDRRQLTLHGPPMVQCLRPPVFDRPYIVAPDSLLGLPNSIPLFTPRVMTPYEEYWRGYPRRRNIPHGAAEDSGADVASSLGGEKQP